MNQAVCITENLCINEQETARGTPRKSMFHIGAKHAMATALADIAKENGPAVQVTKRFWNRHFKKSRHYQRIIYDRYFVSWEYVPRSPFKSIELFAPIETIYLR